MRSLTWEERLPPDGRREGWWPWSDDIGYPQGWWAKRPVPGLRYFSVLDGDVEVARVALDERPNVLGYGAFTSRTLEIERIEVRHELCGQGYGRRIVRQAGEHYPGWCLVARSADWSEWFWQEKLGWERREFEGTDRRPPLYVQPSPRTAGRPSRSGSRR